jgi:hypothetical protein
MMIERTDAKMGRSMKKRDIKGTLAPAPEFVSAVLDRDIQYCLIQLTGR